jgi:dynein heavy chain
MKKINLARENYRKLAKIASKLFFIINDFALIESMYQFSLDAYIGLFQKTIKEYIEKPGLNDSLNEKLDAIADKLKTGIYRYACRGLFEKDKLLLGFMMTVRLKEIDLEEYSYFLKGSKEINVDRKAQPMNPNDWIDPSNWNAICDL